MSHLKTSTKHRLLIATLLSSVALSSAVQANAQSNVSPRFNYATPLAEIASSDNTVERRTLDWRKPSVNFTFDLPAANLTNNIELLISANPQAGVNPRAPLTVQFNNDEPILLNVKGQGFDARVTFDPNKARTSRNIIRLSYNAETGADCIGPQDGAWDIDLNTSKLAINSRAKRRALQFREIDNHLSTPGLAPRTVGLIASGKHATQLQALAAQGIGLRMDSLPDFTTDRRNNDFEIIMARRAELFKYISDDTLIAGRGASIIIPRGRPIKLVFTGDTDAEILSAVKSFAERHLPKARRSVTSLGEMRLQTPLKSNIIRLSGTKNLVDISTASSFSNWSGDDWASGPKSLRFDVTDPSAMTGEILLRLSSSKNISDTSKLSVKLNGESLGTTVLDKRRKSVGFEIKAGTLRGKDNVLTLMPELNPNETPSCNGSIGPNFHLGGGSKIVLNTDVPSAPTELSRMTATAMPFSDNRGAQSYIAMTGNTVDFNASLKVLARLAKTSGEGLIDAKYARTVDVSQTEQKHVLFIGPSNRLPNALVQNAPRALTDALRGQIFEGDNLISANIEQFASLDVDASFKVAAQRLSQSRRISEGGVAALYPSQTSNAHVVGVITNTPGQSYVASAKTISQTQYWSEIKGGVARWNDTSVLSVQAAQIIPGYVSPEGGSSTAQLNFNFDTSFFDGAFNKTTDVIGQAWGGAKSFTAGLVEKVKSIPADKPDTPQPAEKTSQAATPVISIPKIEIPEIKLPDVKAAAKDIQSSTKRRLAKIKRPKPAVNTAQAETLRQGLAKTTRSKLQAANNWANKTGENMRQGAANFEFGKSIDKLQDRVRPMGQSLRNMLKPNRTPQASQSVMQKLLSPAPLILILAFLLALLGLVFSNASSRRGRG